MRSPIILAGKPFDWEYGNAAAENVVSSDGDVDWRAAFSADPGVMRCPGCGEYLWREGQRVRCPCCSAEWDVYPADRRTSSDA